MQSNIITLKKIVFLLFYSILIKNSYAQQDYLIFRHKEVTKLDSIGLVLHNAQRYVEAIDIFDKALEIDSTYGDAIYHRALSIVNSGAKSCNKISICGEFKKALQFGATIEEPTLFFYGCKDLMLENRKSKF